MDQPSGTPRPLESLSRRGLATRARLVDAARRAFERNGYLETRVADIANEARCAHGTFYLYFSSKEDAFIAVVTDYLESLRINSQAHSSGLGPAEAIAAVNLAYIDGWSRHHRLMAAWSVAANHHPAIAELLDARTQEAVERTERLLIRLQRNAEIPDDLDPAVGAHALNAMVLQLCLTLFADDDPQVDVELTARTVTTLWVRGIGLDPNRTPRPNSNN